MVEEIYKEMYYHLFNAITDALETNPKEKTKKTLMQAQIDIEEMFMSYGEDVK